ncbi:hypothetical protein [Sphingomonas sp.]|uniref:hypothetical protein n=1 Tax=Sphingomonas sp. TaxID=28214 RepID=UPI002DD61D5E|nr:hypothetical protein [Sphingomonas sp.]
MPHGIASAQLVTTFDPASPPPAETSIAQALSEWRRLSSAAQSAALLIVHDRDTDRPRVIGREAIAQLLARS